MFKPSRRFNFRNYNWCFHNGPFAWKFIVKLKNNNAELISFRKERVIKDPLTISRAYPLDSEKIKKEDKMHFPTSEFGRKRNRRKKVEKNIK